MRCGERVALEAGVLRLAGKPISQRDLDDAYLTNALIDAHGNDPESGCRFLADELERGGQVVGERRVWRLRSQQRLWSTTVRKGRRGSGVADRGPALRAGASDRGCPPLYGAASSVRR